MPADLTPFVAGWQAMGAGLAVGLAALAAMATDLLSRGPDRDGVAVVGALGLLGAILLAASQWGSDLAGFQNTVRADRFGVFFTILVCGAAALALLMSIEYVREAGIPAGDYYALLLLATCGMVFMALANDLIVVFLGLEIMSVGVYVLTGMLRGDRRSTEAAMKYFVLGAFASGFLLYGIAFLYGAAGSTRLDTIARAIAMQGLSPLVLLGVAFLTAGLAFKLALIPFHAWTPDVYEGAPTAVTAFMAVGVKAAAFAVLARTFFTGLHGLAEHWSGLLAALAVLTMTVGNVLAVVQHNVKRLLAYSSIAHAGYALVGVVVATRDGGAALCFYLVTYTVMNLGAFGVLLALSRRGEASETLDDLAGSGWRHPLLGAAMVLFMLSLAGMPPTAGFAGKFWLFGAAVDADFIGLAVAGVLNSLISVYYYLGVLVQMFMADDRPRPALPSRPWLLAVIVVAVLGTVGLGLLPSWPMELARQAFASLR